jgi:hypothetical protein
VFLATAITLLEGYPWLALQRDDSLDPHNPYKTMFLISNEGYFTATNIEVSCQYDFWATAGVGHAGGKRGPFRSEGNLFTAAIRGSLTHGQSTHLPCVHVLSMNDKPVISEPFSTFMIPADAEFERAEMTAVVRYSIFGIDFRKIRLQKTFRLTALRATDGSYRWDY